MDSTSCAAMTDDALLLAAEYARRDGLYDRAINTAERTTARHDFALRYLTPFRDASSTPPRATQDVDDGAAATASRARNRASLPTSCRRPARSA